MDNFVNEKDYCLINKDKYTFSVLTRIIGGKCELLLTDHENIILCLSQDPYPVWIWTEDNASDEVMEKAFLLALENSFLDGKHRFNLKYPLAEYFIERAHKEGIDLSIETNMFAYDCPSPIPPADYADGEFHMCTTDDLDTLVDFFDDFHNAVEIDKLTRDEYRVKAEEGVKYGSLYLWKNSDGVYTSSCSWHPVREMATVGLVYTRKEHRRKHYAENLVYQVTKLAGDAGYLPMLYTDADYVASNACYEKIGYILRGKLCTIS